MLSAPTNVQETFITQFQNEKNPENGLQYAWHAIGGFEYDLTKTLSLNIEGYYKYLQNIIDFKVGSDFLLNKTIETAILQGTGKSYGVEFSLTKSGRLNGWLNYTYSRSFIKLDGNSTEENYQRFKDEVLPMFDLLENNGARDDNNINENEQLILSDPSNPDNKIKIIGLESLTSSSRLYLGEDEKTGKLYVIKKILSDEERLSDAVDIFNMRLKELENSPSYIYRPKVMSAGKGLWAGMEDALVISVFFIMIIFHVSF